MPYIVEDSEKVACAFVLNEATYRFDGIAGSFNLVDAGKIGEPIGWEFVYRFESRQAGHGDRAGRLLAQVITPHEARITVKENRIVSATMDGSWDMMTQSRLPGR